MPLASASLSEEGEGGGVVDVDDAVAEVADEQVAAEDAEASGSDGYAPGALRLPPVTARETKLPLRSKTSTMPLPAPTVWM